MSFYYVKYLQGEFFIVETVLRPVRGGVAQAPVKSDTSHLKLGPENPSTHKKISSHINGHWRQITHYRNEWSMSIHIKSDLDFFTSETMHKGSILKIELFSPVFPSFFTVVDSDVFSAHPSNLSFWNWILTCARLSSMFIGDCLALLHDGYFFAQLFWFRVPVGV